MADLFFLSINGHINLTAQKRDSFWHLAVRESRESKGWLLCARSAHLPFDVSFRRTEAGPTEPSAPPLDWRRSLHREAFTSLPAEPRMMEWLEKQQLIHCCCLIPGRMVLLKDGVTNWEYSFPVLERIAHCKILED